METPSAMPTPPSFNIPTLPEAPFEVPPMPTMPELSALPTDFPDIPELPGVDLGGAAQASARVGHGVRASIHASMAYLPEMPEVPAEMPSRMFHPMDFVSNVDLASLPTDGLSNLAVPPTTEEATAWVNATGYASAEAAEASAHAAADAAEIASEVAGSLATGSQRALRRATGFVSTASRLPLRMPRFVGPSQALREATFFPLSGMSLDEIIARRGWSHVYADGTAWERAVCDVTKGRAVKFQTADGRKLSAMWCPRVYDSELKEREFQRLLVGSRPGMESGGLGSMGTGGIELPSEAAVIIFHANAMVGLDMAEYAMWYNQQGMHALIVTLGGYGASEAPPDGPSEGSSYLDADAALYWLRQEGCPGLALRRIVAHGLSLGGAQAAALAAHHKGLHVSLDQTFGSAEQVARHVASHHLGFTSTWAADTVAATAIPDHRREKEWQRNVDGGDGDDCDDNVAVLRGNNHHPRAINTPTMNPLPHQTTLPWPFCGAALPGFLGFGSGVQSDSNNSSSSSHQSSGRRVIKGLRDPKAHKSMLLVAASADADWAETGEGCVEANHPYYALDGYNTEAKLQTLRSDELEMPSSSLSSNSRQLPTSSQSMFSSNRKRESLGKLFVFSAADDALMPQVFVEQLLLARYGEGWSEIAPSRDGLHDAEARADSSSSAGGDDMTAVESVTAGIVQHSEGSAISEQQQLEERLARLEALAPKWAVLEGQHGTFFGDQPKPADKYRSHLEGLGLVAPQKLHVEAIREAKLIARAKRATTPAP